MFPSETVNNVLKHLLVIREELEDVTMSIFDLMGSAEDTSLSNFLVKQKVVEVFQV